MLNDVEAEFHEAYTFGPLRWGRGRRRVGRQVPSERRLTSHYGEAFRHHVQSPLREAGVVGDHTMLAHALLAFVDLKTLDHLRKDNQVTTARLQSTWTDLVRRVTDAGER